jgi:hypothetical protein
MGVVSATDEMLEKTRAERGCSGQTTRLTIFLSAVLS